MRTGSPGLPSLPLIGPIALLAMAGLAAIAVSACASGGTSPSPGAASPSGSVELVPDASAPVDADDPAAIARRYVEALAGGDYATAEAMADATMRAAAPAASLAVLWSQIQDQFGAYDRVVDTSVAAQDPYTNVTVTTAFEKATVPVVVTLTEDGLVGGLHLGQPGSASPAASAAPASYVDPSAFTEADVAVGQAPWALPGTLSMPAGEGPFPAVVLLAGSGPNDRDETIGPNTPLRDLAWGLASQGIAVLRYDKRTLAHREAMAALESAITVHEETMDDALLAVDLLRSTPGVDPDRVVVAGHSLGGYLAPRIAAEDPGPIAGIALLEANASPLQDLVADQIAYLASPDGGADPTAAKMLDGLADKVALVDSPDLTPSTPATELPLGIPAAYWLDLRGYDPVATAAGLTIPVFISQGGRDYEVPPSELELWTAGLAGRKDVAIHEYPALNHLLMAGSGPSRPAEYTVPGHVDAGLVADLEAWVTSIP